MRNIIVRTALALLVALAPASSALASIITSEVMYDPPGTDTKREWVEWQVVSTTSIDISMVRMVEGGVAHKITVFAGAPTTLAPGSFVVVADDAASFLVDYPGYDGALYDSVFSLANTGEELSVTVDGAVVDSLVYTSASGGAGTGAALTRSGPSRPSPGEANPSERWDGDVSLKPEEPSGASGGSSGGSGDVSTHAGTVTISPYVPKGEFQVSAGRDRAVSINVPILFESQAKGAPSGFGVRWSFGDGEKEHGVRHEHTYAASGTYAVVANAVARGTDERSVDRIRVEVFVPELALGYDDSGYVVQNVTGREVNLGGFRYRFDGGAGEWPEDTIVLAGEAVRLQAATSTCGLSISYPNGAQLLPRDCPAAVQSSP